MRRGGRGIEEVQQRFEGIKVPFFVVVYDVPLGCFCVYSYREDVGDLAVVLRRNARLRVVLEQEFSKVRHRLLVMYKYQKKKKNYFTCTNNIYKDTISSRCALACVNDSFFIPFFFFRL